jgi:hypothetical protein
MALWCGKNSGSTSKDFLLPEALTRFPQAYRILHCMHHFQTHHKEKGAIHPAYS